MKRKIVYVVGDTAGIKAFVPASADTSYLEYIFKSYDLVNLGSVDSTIAVKLRYADTSNFLHSNFYDGLRNAYFTCDLALRLANAQYFLRQVDSSLTLVVLDAARPLHIQAMMWDSLKMHPDLKYNYLSPPDETSLHNYGCAADVTIMRTTDSTVLDMGTEFDQFSRLSQPIYETVFLKNGELDSMAWQNRRLLRYIMKRAGLKGINSEWWHFSLCTREEAAKGYQLIR